MKRLFILLLLLIIPLSLQAQGLFKISYSSYYDVEFTNTETKIVYVLFPDNEGKWYIASTKPTQYYSGTTNYRSHDYIFSGDFMAYIELNKGDGMIDAETDSFYTYVKPLIWEPKDAEYTVIETDSFFVKWNVVGNYIGDGTGVYINLDWTDGQPYSSMISAGLWPCAGFAFYNVQSNYTSGKSTATFWFSLSREWR